MTRLFIDVHSALPVRAEIYTASGLGNIEAPGIVFEVPDELWNEYQIKYREFHNAESAILSHAQLTVPHKSW